MYNKWVPGFKKKPQHTYIILAGITQTNRYKRITM